MREKAILVESSTGLDGWQWQWSVKIIVPHINTYQEAFTNEEALNNPVYKWFNQLIVVTSLLATLEWEWWTHKMSGHDGRDGSYA